jgi:hypothetical protein
MDTPNDKSTVELLPRRGQSQRVKVNCGENDIFAFSHMTRCVWRRL